MTFYNFVIPKFNLTLSIQPKCGCSSIKNFVKTNGGHRINKKSIYNEFKHFENVLIFRDPYKRLVSYYNLFVIQGNYRNLWFHADAEKKISLEKKSFKEFIYIMKDMNEIDCQHHLEPQTLGINLLHFNKIINIENFNNFIKKYTQFDSIKNRPAKFDYKNLMINKKPDEYNIISTHPKVGVGGKIWNIRKACSYNNLYDKELENIIKNYIYPQYYKKIQSNINIQ